MALGPYMHFRFWGDSQWHSCPAPRKVAMSPGTLVLGRASVRQCISIIVWRADLNLEALKIRRWRRGPSSDQRCTRYSTSCF